MSKRSKKINVVLSGGDLPLAIDDGRQSPGIICLANEERFTAAHFSEPLTTYAVGYRDPTNIEATLDAMFPAVSVSRRFEFKAAVNAEEFYSESDDIRAIGSPFKRVQYGRTSVNERTYNKGLTVRLDHDDRVDGDEEQAVSRLIRRLNRNDLRRGVALVVAAATNTAKTWDTTAGKNPDMDILADLITGGDARGMESNVVVFGQTAWQKRLLSYEAQDLAGQHAHAVMTAEQLADWLGIDKVVKSKERYSSDSTTRTKIVGSYVLMYYAEQNASKDDPSNTKRFWTPTDSGRFRVYREEHAKYTDISVEHYSNLVTTSTLGIRMFTIS